MDEKKLVTEEQFEEAFHKALDEIKSVCDKSDDEHGVTKSDGAMGTLLIVLQSMAFGSLIRKHLFESEE